MLNFGGNPPAPLSGICQRHSDHILGTTAASSSSPTCALQDGACGGRGHNNSKIFIHTSLVGQPLSSLTSPIFHEAAAGIGAIRSYGEDLTTAAAFAATNAATAAGACAELYIAWPPTFPVGAPAEVVELRAALSLDTAAAATVGGCSDEAAGLSAAINAAGGGAAAVLAAAAAGCCSRLLAFNEDFVVGDEVLQISKCGVASARLRLHADAPGVTSCILTGHQGVPTLESFQDPAPLMGLPQAARDEAHRLLWRMMHEALPANHSVLPYDPDAFRTPIDLLPPKLQAALSWAWTHHFRPFAHDFGFLLESLPAAETVGGGDREVAAAAACTPHVAASPSYTAEVADGNVDELSHYQSVLAQMVAFLRDNDMFACLATLLQTAVARGLTLLGEDGASVNLAAASPQLASQLRTPCGGTGGDKSAAALSSALAALRAAAATRSVGAAAEEASYGNNGWMSEPASAHGSPRVLRAAAVAATASGDTVYNHSYTEHAGGDTYRAEAVQVWREEPDAAVENVRGPLGAAGCSNGANDLSWETSNAAAKKWIVTTKPRTDQLQPLLALGAVPLLGLVICVLVAAAVAAAAAVQRPDCGAMCIMMFTEAVFEHSGGVISVVALVAFAVLVAVTETVVLSPLRWRDGHSWGPRDGREDAVVAAVAGQHGILQLMAHIAGAMLFGAVTWCATSAAAAAAAATVARAAHTPVLAATAVAIAAAATVIRYKRRHVRHRYGASEKAGGCGPY